MKTAIIYHSATGFTKRYASWLGDITGASLFTLEHARTQDLSGYDAIVFGSWVHAGTIRRLDWFTKSVVQAPWSGTKKLVVFAVGAMPAGSPEAEMMLAQAFAREPLRSVDRFYCPGGLNYEAMSLSSHLMMKAFAGMTRLKKSRTPAEEEMIRVISSSYDISDRKYLEPILKVLDAD